MWNTLLTSRLYRSLGSVLIGLCCSFVVAPVFAATNVPVEFYPNYEIADEYDELLDMLIVIESKARVDANPEEIDFDTLGDLFDEVFEFFPQTATSRILYESCRAVTNTLATDFSWNDYYVFKDRCFTPLNELVGKINSDYTVKPQIDVAPSQGPAPLNVTLDARGSIDPSDDTIPSNNFFWYYKDVDGEEQPIGRGPVVNHTFTEPGRHIVHLTVRSSNNLSEGIFDGEANVPINVAPRAANLVVYVNGRRATTDDVLRIGTQEALDGIFIDGTATAPIGQRTILRHERNISGKQGQQFERTRSGEGPPGQFNQRFPENGAYSVRLTIEDNEGNRMYETFDISVSDPVANIKYRPEEGTTSSTYRFDGSTSYSLTSRIRTYQWVVTNPEGEQIDTVESKELTKKFAYPGTYTVKLTVTDELGNQSYDTQQVVVGSTPPVPSFTVTSSSDLKYPSKFVLDATPTYDLDVTNGADELDYTWTFSSNDQVEVVEEQDNGRRIVAEFNQAGTYQVRLLVEDAYGELVEIEKKIVVESTLRPELRIDPVVTQWDSPITFSVTSNKQVAYYEWDFGDGTVDREQSSTVQHTYDEAGIYPVTLKVVTAEDESNEITRQVFVGQQDQPTAAYEIRLGNNRTLTPTTTCTTDEGETVAAYQVERYQQITLDASRSTNVQGTSQGLAIQFHPLNDEIYTKNVLTYNFPLLGCQPVQLFVDDTSKGETATRTIWFEVTNALPVLSSLELEFPQSTNNNTVGIGFNVEQTSEREIFSDDTLNSIVVRIAARGARDPDGIISHFVWYYYPSNDPDRILALKVTPGDIPHATFVVPKPYNPTEYAFAVRIVDNNDGEITSEEILGQGPLVFFPPTENSLDVPIVTLKTDKVDVKVGEEITFTAQASILSNRPDFASSRYFKYDFDGDGRFDLTTKRDEVTHAYQQPGEKFPKASVFYRERAGIGNAQRIVVKRGINPVFLYDTHDKKVLVKQMSAGSIESQSICMDIRVCRDDEERIKEGEEPFVFEYDEYGDYFLQQSVTDEFANEETRREQISLTPAGSGEIGILSLPEGQEIATGGHTIAVGNLLNNTVVYYIDYEGGNCFMDVDISSDTDKDGDPTADKDIECNKVVSHRYHPANKQQFGRIYYVQDGEIKEKNVTISFIDFEEVVDDEFQWAADKIDELLTEVDVDTQDDILKFYRDLLVNLKSSLGERNEMNSTLIQLRDLLETYPNVVDLEHRLEVSTLITGLSDSTVQSAFGGTVYDSAKANVLSWFPPSSKQEATRLFAEFESLQGNQEEMKAKLDEVFNLAASERSAGRIDDVDFADIQRNLCDIIVYYELPSKTCGTLPDEAAEEDEQQESSSLFRRVVRIVLWVVGILAVIFVAIIIFFAIKARSQAEAQEDAAEKTEEG